MQVWLFAATSAAKETTKATDQPTNQAAGQRASKEDNMPCVYNHGLQKFLMIFTTDLVLMLHWDVTSCTAGTGSSIGAAA